MVGTSAEWSGANDDHHLPMSSAFSSAALGEPKTSSAPFDVTFVTQASIDRVWLMADTCVRWTGPIVLVVFLSEEPPFKTDGILLPTVCNSGRSSSTSPGDSIPSGSLSSNQSRMLVNRQIRDEPARVKSALFVGSSDAEYPVNHLRNLAIGLVETSHFLVADVDFVPSRNLYTEVLQHGYHMLNDLMLAVVVPVFQRRVRSCSSVADCRALVAQTNPIPASLEELQQCVTGIIPAPATETTLEANSSRSLRSRSGNCIVFQAESNYHGHSTTRSSDWLAASAHWPVPQPITCIDSIRYEPYLVLSTWGPATPRYDEQFTGYGKNKIQFVNHLRVAGFKFSVLPREFLVHFPHPFSPAKLAWARNTTLRKHVDTQFASFMKKLAREYSGLNSSVTPLCS